MNKIKLGLTYYGDKIEGLWSGTLDRMDDVLKKDKDYLKSYTWVSIAPKMSYIYRLLLKTYHKFFFSGSGICREVMVYNRTVKSFLRNNKNLDVDWILMVAEHCLNTRINKTSKYACYIDTDYPITAQFDYRKHKLGYGFYLNFYDKKSFKSYKAMDLIFTQNEWTRKSIINRFSLSPKKVINVGFGINIEPLFEEKKFDKNLLLIVLREYNHKTKGLDLLVKALPLIRKKYPDIRLAVVGNDIYRNSDGIDTYYNYPRSKTKELFKEATLYVMPSRNEPNGITYLEALCNKTPFVALNRFAAKEFSQNGKYGFLCDYDTPESIADTIINALTDKNKLKKMGEDGQKFVLENYTWEKTVKTMLKYMYEYE